MNRIRQKAALKTQLAESQARLNELTENLSDAGLNTKTFINGTDRDFRQTDEGKAALAEFTAKEAELKALYDTEKASHAQLQSDYDAIILTFTQADLAEQYNQIDTTGAQLQTLITALDRAQSEAPTLETVNTAAPLRDELQNCLVNKALGQDVGKELERLEKAIAKAETSDTMANAEVMTAQARHSATVSGLEDKIALERTQLADLKKDAQVIKAALLADKAQAIGT